ncbi:MAG: hypothetical protein AB7F43_06160 [Bacteriovoracia bacterium]
MGKRFLLGFGLVFFLSLPVFSAFGQDSEIEIRKAELIHDKWNRYSVKDLRNAVDLVMKQYATDINTVLEKIEEKQKQELDENSKDELQKLKDTGRSLLINSVLQVTLVEQSEPELMVKALAVPTGIGMLAGLYYGRSAVDPYLPSCSIMLRDLSALMFYSVALTAEAVAIGAGAYSVSWLLGKSSYLKRVADVAEKNALRIDNALLRRFAKKSFISTIREKNPKAPAKFDELARWIEDKLI